MLKNDAGTPAIGRGDLAKRPGFLFGKSIVYYLDEGKVNPVCVQVPLKIYKEFIEGNNMFSIETFFDIK